jgi:hypothetical protein
LKEEKKLGEPEEDLGLQDVNEENDNSGEIVGNEDDELEMMLKMEDIDDEEEVNASKG